MGSISKKAQPRTKGETSTNNILYLILTLKNHSDRNHPLSIREITESLNNDFGSYGIQLDRTTVLRQLNKLESERIGLFREQNDEITEITDSKDLDLRHNLGFYIVGFEDNGTKYYYYESVLLESELMTLYDAIETYNYFAVDDIKSISLKLSTIRPLSEDKLKYYPSQTDWDLKEDNTVLQNISTLAGIIQSSQLADIDYGEYNKSLKLAQKKGYPKTLRPLRLLWSNGYYYCIMGIKGYSNTINLRVDRILSIDPVPADSKQLKEYSGFDGINGSNDPDSKSSYRSKNPVMYSGAQRNFHILVNASANNMMNTIVDVFGKNKKTVPVDADTAKKYHITAGDWVQLHLKCTADGMELFATEYCRDVIIISPEKSAQNVRETLKLALTRYGM